jgi:hypothetical protein
MIQQGKSGRSEEPVGFTIGGAAGALGGYILGERTGNRMEKPRFSNEKRGSLLNHGCAALNYSYAVALMAISFACQAIFLMQSSMVM